MMRDATDAFDEILSPEALRLAKACGFIELFCDFVYDGGHKSEGGKCGEAHVAFHCGSPHNMHSLSFDARLQGDENLMLCVEEEDQVLASELMLICRIASECREDESRELMSWALNVESIMGFDERSLEHMVLRYGLQEHEHVG